MRDRSDRSYRNSSGNGYDERRYTYAGSHGPRRRDDGRHYGGIADARVVRDYSNGGYDPDGNGNGNGNFGMDNELIEEGEDDPFGIDRDYSSKDGNEIGPVPEILLVILETAVCQLRDEMATTSARAASTTETTAARTSAAVATAAASSNATPVSGSTTHEDLRRNRHHLERLEQTWKAVRTYWLWAHDAPDDRAVGARVRSEIDGGAPLHLLCKLSPHPPTDILRELLRSAPEVTTWKDAHGCLPLHHACIRGASGEVLELLTDVFPESRSAVDSNHRTPLHLYATQGMSDRYNPTTLAANFAMLCVPSSSPSSLSSSLSLSSSQSSGMPHRIPFNGRRGTRNTAFIPARVRDAAGMIPMHYACAYGTTPSVLRVLREAFPDCLEARDDLGRTPLHFAMANAQRGTSPGVIGFLLGHHRHRGGDGVTEAGGGGDIDIDDDDDDDDRCDEGTNTESAASTGSHPATAAFFTVHHQHHFHKIASVDVRDRGGNLPLHLLNRGLAGTDLHNGDPNPAKNAAECLRLYLEARPHVSTDFLAALQALPDPLRDVAVVSPHVRSILNAKIIRRFPTSILMLDGIMLVTMIVSFELATTSFVDQAVTGDESLGNGSMSSPLVMLYATTAYFFLRELIQVVASIALNAFGSWLYDTTNWLDVLVIALVTHYSTAMTLGEPYESVSTLGKGGDLDEDGLGGFRTGTALTKGVLWTAVIFFLKSTQVDFAVFLGGVFYVVRRLVAFLLAILVILISFAQMFWVVYLERPVCRFSCPAEDRECAAEMEGCSYPHCEFGDSFLKVYTMMMGEIGTETRYDQNLVAQILYIFYGFFIVILLSNVLIAIVTDSYEVVQNDRAAIVFWSNRLDFVAEMDSIASVVRKRVFCIEGGGDDDDDDDDAMGKPARAGPIGPSNTHDDRSSASNLSYRADIDDPRVDRSEEWFRDRWNSIVSMFEHDVYGDGGEDVRPIDFWYDVLNKTMAVLVIPPWLILGFVTVGILWPPQVREWLFVQKDTAASRAEIERMKLEQLREIQRDAKRLKDDLRMEMQQDRAELFRTKAEVDAVQEEVLADLQQVNALVTTLLTDLGDPTLEGG